ncbi:MAG TPA: hypothetical protein VNI52_14420 [Sphingobacteriaceae bacterium]|nr:hypothetical protein [Sphingobacteriaceae bacterium]
MKKATYLLSALLFAATTLFAQDHKHGSPHGGEVKTAGTAFHIEALVKKGVLIVYLLDANEKTMSIAGATATALIQTANGKVSTSALKANGKANFIYHLSPAIKYNKAIITLKKGGKTASASFDLNKKTPGKASETAGHHH